MRLLTALLVVGSAAAVPVTVQTTYGPVVGTSDATQDTAAFLGVPFAAPPVGALRFHPPAAPSPWTQPLNTTTQPAPCLQSNHWQPGSVSVEDCLYLNGARGA